MYTPDSFPQYPKSGYDAGQIKNSGSISGGQALGQYGEQTRNKSQIELELDDLQTSIAQLGAGLEILESRLMFVLDPGSPAKESQPTGANPMPGNKLGAMLYGQKQIVREMQIFVQSILERLAV